MERTISQGLKVTFFAGFCAAGIFGVIYLFFPVAYQSLIGVPIKQPAELTSFREFGVAFLALAYLSWRAFRAAAVNEAAMALGMVIVWMILGALAMLWSLVTSELPGIYWLYFVLFTGFAVAGIVFYPRGVKEARQ